jgi:16S rRNA (cytosine1402-N4)-methyltransferase
VTVSFEHATVLAAEAVELLAPQPGRVVVDCTLGGGGHTERFLDAGATVFAIDRDPAAHEAARGRLARFGARFHPLVGNFAQVKKLLDDEGVSEVDGVLADLGVSSPQLDVAERGFSFSRPGPLDMRMGPDAERLSDYLARVDETELIRVLREYGEEPFARPVARALLGSKAQDTAALAHDVGAAIPRGAWPKRIHPATRTFQALRIAVNGELDALDSLLGVMPSLVKIGGRLAVISFHSLEDRRVKQAFRALEGECTCPPGLPVCVCGVQGTFRSLGRKAAVASDEEIERNPRARSAKLRAVERIQ